MKNAEPTRVPFLDLPAEYIALRDEILAALDRVGRRAVFVLGAEVEAFEKEFAALCGARHCVAVNSGTSALHLGLLALGVRPGDEVITTPNTFIATAEAISYCGAQPVFVDIDSHTGNIDAGRIEAAVTPRTKAILPVHLYGRPADLDAIGEIGRRRGLPVLEDACQAHGARYRGRPAGSLGRAAAFSFYPTKNVSAYGEGGALTTDDAGIAEFARAARNHGQQGRYVHDFIGYNYRMTGYQGAVLRVKLRHLPEWMTARTRLAGEYRRRLSSVRLEMPQDHPRDEPAYHLFAVYVEQRDMVRQKLEARGIETAVHYPCPVHLQPAYAALGHGPGSFPHAERACRRVLNLPLFPAMTVEQVAYVSETLKEIVGEKERAGRAG